MNSIKSNQRGMSYFDFLLIAAVLVAVVIFGMRLIPAYINNADIQHIFNDVAHDPAMKNASVGEIKMSYNRRASVEGLTGITADDIDINTDNSTLSLSAKYTVKIPLVGNATLLLDFNPSSS